MLLLPVLLLFLALLLVLVLAARPAFRVLPPPRAAVLVTGTSSGFGCSIAQALCARGYCVFCGARRLADVRALAERWPSRARPLLLDVTRPEQIEEAVQQVARVLAEERLELAAVVMNAGVQCVGPLELVPLAAVRETFEVNVFGLLATVQAFLPPLRAGGGGGRVVLLGSSSSLVAPVFYGAYAATKHALESLADALRAELLPLGNPVSLVQAGSAHTNIENKMDEQLERHAAGNSPYAPRLAALRQLLALSLRSGLLPGADLATRAVVHAVSARRPRARYLAGLDAWLFWAVVRFVPGHLLDLIQLKLMPPA